MGGWVRADVIITGCWYGCMLTAVGMVGPDKRKKYKFKNQLEAHFLSQLTDRLFYSTKNFSIFSQKSNPSIDYFFENNEIILHPK